MNISIIGATGFVGSALVKEASGRGHKVTAVARDTTKLNENAELIVKSADVTNEQELAKAVAGADVVVSAFNAGWNNPDLYADFLAGSQKIEAGVLAAGVKRLIVIGGAGSLYIAPGVQLVDTPEFPAAYKSGATAARDYLNLLKENKELDWTFVSPAIEMHPGITTGRTGKYRTALENPVFDEQNRSTLSVEDLAVAVIDEAENGKFIRQRFTAAY